MFFNNGIWGEDLAPVKCIYPLPPQWQRLLSNLERWFFWGQFIVFFFLINNCVAISVLVLVLCCGCVVTFSSSDHLINVGRR